MKLPVACPGLTNKKWHATRAGCRKYFRVSRKFHKKIALYFFNTLHKSHKKIANILFRHEKNHFRPPFVTSSITNAIHLGKNFVLKRKMFP